MLIFQYTYATLHSTLYCTNFSQCGIVYFFLFKYLVLSNDNICNPLLSGMNFAVIGIHTAPLDAVTEIDHLVDVYEDAKRRFSINNVILMGDFNAGCTYVTDWSSIRLASDHRFYWLINDITDTTSGSTECAYDR